jgi:hypothetical protein
LKARANEAEMQLKRNDKLKALEDEKEWYRKEVRDSGRLSHQNVF